MKICNREIKAIIFDLDGTLIDSTFVWREVDKEFFGRRNREIPPTYMEDIAHVGLPEAANLTRSKYGIKESQEEILKEWHDSVAYKYEHQIQLKPFVKEYLDYLKKNNIKLAIATASQPDLYEPCLKRLGVFDYFVTIADVNKVQAGKSSAKLYNHVAEILEEKPENIVVFEDIYVGLKTAYENGYLAIAVDDAHSRKDDELKEKYSHLFIKSFEEML